MSKIYSINIVDENGRTVQELSLVIDPERGQVGDITLSQDEIEDFPMNEFVSETIGDLVLMYIVADLASKAACHD
jgi:hypothetical protein